MQQEFLVSAPLRRGTTRSALRPARSQRLTSQGVRAAGVFWKLISKKPLPEDVGSTSEDNFLPLGRRQDTKHQGDEDRTNPQRTHNTVSRFLNAHFRALVLLAVERELRLGKHERADGGAGSAIQFLICRTRSRDPSVTIWSTKLRQ